LRAASQVLTARLHEAIFFGISNGEDYVTADVRVDGTSYGALTAFE